MLVYSKGKKSTVVKKYNDPKGTSTTLWCHLCNLTKLSFQCVTAIPRGKHITSHHPISGKYLFPGNIPQVAMALVYFWVILNTQLVIPCLIYCRCQCTDSNWLFTISSLSVHHHRPHPRTLICIHVCYIIQFAVIMDSIPQPQDRLVVIPSGLSKGCTS